MDRQCPYIKPLEIFEEHITAMGRFGRECATMIFFVVFSLVAAERNNGNDLSTSTMATGRGLQLGDKNGPALRVESHLGRRKRNSPFENYYRIPGLGREQVDGIDEIPQEIPWAILTFNEGKRRALNFTPRLGRESGEDAEPDNWLRDSGLSKELMTQRSPPFAPRLGRRSNNYYFDPRLGKRNDQQKAM